MNRKPLNKVGLLAKIAADRRLKPSSVLVAIVLVNRTNPHSGQCNPSYARVSEDLGISRRAAIAGVKDLQSAGWLRVEANRNTSNNYVFADNGNGLAAVAGVNGRALGGEQLFTSGSDPAFTSAGERTCTQNRKGKQKGETENEKRDSFPWGESRTRDVDYDPDWDVPPF